MLEAYREDMLASMRPRHKAAENPERWLLLGFLLVGFNEAAA